MKTATAAVKHENKRGTLKPTEAKTYVVRDGTEGSKIGTSVLDVSNTGNQNGGAQRTSTTRTGTSVHTVFSLLNPTGAYSFKGGGGLIGEGGGLI